MLRLTEDQVRAHQARVAGQQPRVIAAAVQDKVVNTARTPYRSRLEEEYAFILEMRKRAGEIRDFGYERVTLWLQGRVRYTPDFDVERWDGFIELHECKGWNRESGRNKLRGAIESFPAFHWYIVGTSKEPRRLQSPDDVPAIRKVVR